MDKTSTPPNLDLIADVIRYTNPFTFQTILFDRAKALNLLKNVNFHYCPDYYLIARLLEVGTYLHVDDVLVSYRVHSSNLSKTVGARKIIEPLTVMKLVYKNHERRKSLILPVRLRLLVYLFFNGRKKMSARYLRGIPLVATFSVTIFGIYYFFCFGYFPQKIKRSISAIFRIG